MEPRTKEVGLGRKLAQILALLVLVFLFLVAVKLVGSTFKELGKVNAASLLAGIQGPFAGLCVGILATVIVQSSSATTSMIVLIVSEGQMNVDVAVFAIMGCNIGTTVTNTLVSMGHVRQNAEFRRAFAGATMHDFFNLMAITILMPLEILTGYLQTAATYLSGFVGGVTSAGFESPIKAAVGAVAKPIKDFAFKTLGVSPGIAGTLLILFSVLLLFFALMSITRIMRALMAERLEKSLNALLGRSGALSIFIGCVVTVSVQSSSITTSLMVPLFAAGLLRLENGLPVTVGANIGTTITAFIASLAGNVTGLTIAIVHLLFNLSATLLIYPIPALRRFPVRMSRRLALATMKNRFYALYYVIGVFVVIPLLGTILFR